jgi:tripartite-type tricarboxylate transporter receptor subunit TctC
MRRRHLPALLASPALAQGRSLRLVVPFPPGGSLDVLTRLVQPRLAERMGSVVLIENRAGAGTIIGTDAVAKAAADGGTALMIANSFTINATLARNPPFDARRDFTGVASLGFNPHVLVAAPGFAPRSVAEVVAAARAAPGTIAYASFGNGTSAHLGGESFKRAAGIELQHIPYRGAAPALADVMGGQVPLMFSNLPEALPLIREGRVRAIALSNPGRVPSLPDTPTFDEAGVPGVVSNSWFGMVARAESPPAALDALAAAVNATLAEPAMIERFNELGVTPRPMLRPAFDTFMREEIENNARIIRATAITAD